MQLEEPVLNLKSPTVNYGRNGVFETLILSI